MRFCDSELVLLSAFVHIFQMCVAMADESDAWLHAVDGVDSAFAGKANKNSQQKVAKGESRASEYGVFQN